MIKRSFTFLVVVNTVSILALALLLTLLINLYKFGQTFDEFLQDRSFFIQEEVKTSLEAKMSLGLDLSELNGVNALLDDIKATDENILSIEVFNKEGQILFSTDRSFVGDVISEQWELTWKQSEDGRWGMVDSDALVTGLELKDLMGLPTGNTVLRYSREFRDDIEVQLFRQLVKYAIILLAGFSMVGLLAALVLLNPICRYFRRLNTNLHDLAFFIEQGESNDFAQNSKFRDDVGSEFTIGVVKTCKNIKNTLAQIRKLDEKI